MEKEARLELLLGIARAPLLGLEDALRLDERGVDLLALLLGHEDLALHLVDVGRELGLTAARTAPSAPRCAQAKAPARACGCGMSACAWHLHLATRSVVSVYERYVVVHVGELVDEVVAVERELAERVEQAEQLALLLLELLLELFARRAQLTLLRAHNVHNTRIYIFYEFTLSSLNETLLAVAHQPVVFGLRAVQHQTQLVVFCNCRLDALLQRAHLLTTYRTHIKRIGTAQPADIQIELQHK